MKSINALLRSKLTSRKHVENSPPEEIEEEKIHTMPTTNVECPKCGNNEAFWWFLQTRGGDEPTTQFYRCKKCEHTWREYA